MNIKTVVEIDLVGYTPISRMLEQSLNAEVVARFNDQIQAFVDTGLAAIGAAREQIVLATTGDGAILVFDKASDAHCFAEAVHRATQKHNAERTIGSSHRWFRIGASTGEFYQHGHKIAGTVIPNAVRMETAAKRGQFLIDAQTYATLPAEFQCLYADEETVVDKNGEARRSYGQ